MRAGEATAWRRARAWLLFCAALPASACTSANDVGGIWRAEAPLHSSGNDVVFQGETDPVGVELVVGEYGPDVTGVIHFYHAGPTGPFDRARSALAPDFECACDYLHGGRIDAGTGALTFSLTGCAPGLNQKGVVRLRGRLALQADQRLAGTLQVDDPGSPQNGASVDLVFDRAHLPADIEATDLQCIQPADMARGNTNSGL